MKTNRLQHYLVKAPGMRIALAVAIVIAIVVAAVYFRPQPLLSQVSNVEEVGFSQAGIDDLHEVMHRQVDEGTLPGIVGMLARHGKIVDVDVYGMQNIASGTPMTRDTIFRLYSQTKPVASVALLILYDEGKWELDDPITKFIPEFSDLQVYAGTGQDGLPILEPMQRPPTMRELMSHTAGFASGLSQDNYADAQFFEKVWSSGMRAPKDLSDFIAKVAQVPLLYQPSTDWDYGAANDIMGAVVERISGMSFDDFLKTRLFTPLGMKDTGFMVDQEQSSRLAGLYIPNPEDGGLIELVPDPQSLFPQDYTKPTTFYSGGGGLVSTVDDYARFAQMILNGGEYNGVRILRPETVALLSENQVPNTITPQIQSGFAFTGEGMGWSLASAVIYDSAASGWASAEGTITWHGLGGTWFWIDPKNDLFYLGMVQRAAEDQPLSENLIYLSNQAVYAALRYPER